MNDIKRATVSITVTVPYGGDTEEAERIIKRTADALRTNASFAASWYDVEPEQLTFDCDLEVHTEVAFA